MMMSLVTNVTTAVILMATIGFCGGLLVVPFKALLQERGHRSVGAGSAWTVQNFCENLAMPIFVGGCSLAISTKASTNHTVAGFKIVLLLAISIITTMRYFKHLDDEAISRSSVKTSSQCLFLTN